MLKLHTSESREEIPVKLWKCGFGERRKRSG
jgi:hypothetical protein